MVDPIKVISAEVALTTATTLGSASLVRIVNADPSNAATITVKSGATVVGSFTLGSSGTDYSSEYVIKQPTDTIEATGGQVRAAALAYR